MAEHRNTLGLTQSCQKCFIPANSDFIISHGLFQIKMQKMYTKRIRNDVNEKQNKSAFTVALDISHTSSYSLKNTEKLLLHIIYILPVLYIFVFIQMNTNACQLQIRQNREEGRMGLSGSRQGKGAFIRWRATAWTVFTTWRSMKQHNLAWQWQQAWRRGKVTTPMCISGANSKAGWNTGMEQSLSG